MFTDRVLSGMRPTGRMHIGHYHGALKNWVKLQEEYECLYFAADWHALTTHYDATESIADSVWEMFIDWFAAGINPTLINGLLERLRQANRDFGITLLVIEHNMRVIMQLAEYIYCLAHGELLAEGKPEEVQKDQRVLDAYLGAT